MWWYIEVNRQDCRPFGPQVEWFGRYWIIGAMAPFWSKPHPFKAEEIDKAVERFRSPEFPYNYPSARKVPKEEFDKLLAECNA